MTKSKLRAIAKGPLLTLEFESVEEMSAHLENISNFSEKGTIRRRQGHNFSAAAARSYFKTQSAAGKLTEEELSIKKLLETYKNIEYVVAWRRGDVAAKVHELAHSRWALNRAHRAAIIAAWEGLPPLFQMHIRRVLVRLGYEDSDDVIIDEFGAYWLTERNAAAFLGVQGMPAAPETLRNAVFKA